MTLDEMAVAVLQSGGVSVDSEGRVWRHRKRSGRGKATEYAQPRRLDSPNDLGYHAVKLGYAGKRFQTSAHRLQWLANNGPIPDGLEVNHKDTNKSNNRLDNLELLTHLQNLEHAAKAKGGWWIARQGEKHHKAKLDWEKVRWIRANVGKGPGKITQAAAAEKFGVTPVQISGIMGGKYWKETT